MEGGFEGATGSCIEDAVIAVRDGGSAGGRTVDGTVEIDQREEVLDGLVWGLVDRGGKN